MANWWDTTFGAHQQQARQWINILIPLSCNTCTAHLIGSMAVSGWAKRTSVSSSPDQHPFRTYHERRRCPRFKVCLRIQSRDSQCSTSFYSGHVFKFICFHLQVPDGSTASVESTIFYWPQSIWRFRVTFRPGSCTCICTSIWVNLCSCRHSVFPNRIVHFFLIWIGLPFLFVGLVRWTMSFSTNHTVFLLLDLRLFYTHRSSSRLGKQRLVFALMENSRLGFMAR